MRDGPRAAATAYAMRAARTRPVARLAAAASFVRARAAHSHSCVAVPHPSNVPFSGALLDVDQTCDGAGHPLRPGFIRTSAPLGRHVARAAADRRAFDRAARDRSAIAPRRRARALDPPRFTH
ncbi:hypothetical protein F5D26_10380 [Burkholderia pseudomallei]|nr:hypothetical protein F5D26_10380 [Burkholderia pseudomallei]MBM5645832.1 hypothetical protein [Burkholderia pseudomallei]NRE33431.1 hypothetical protein [Burkholderia pseudomallei]QBL81720.1 hypothetical protein EYA82_29835 [Burkholderia pseudomallei]